MFPENGAQPLDQVLQDVKRILDISGLVVGPAMPNDINYLRGMDFSDYEIRDTRKCLFYQTYDGKYKEKPALKRLSKDLLNWDIHKADHQLWNLL